MKKTNPRGYFKLENINTVIKYLTISDILIISGFGLVAPIFAIFITDSIKGGSVEVAGIASAIFLFSKSLGQIPVASVIDRIKGELDDLWFLLVGSIIFSLIPLLYIVIDTPVQLYIVQCIYGLATAATLPSWYAMFTRHIDKAHEGVEWGVYQTLVDLGSAGAASIGGFLAVRIGFNNLFIIVTIVSFVGTMFLLGTHSNLFIKDKK